jgi:hypothetical protein
VTKYLINPDVEHRLHDNEITLYDLYRKIPFIAVVLVNLALLFLVVQDDMQLLALLHPLLNLKMNKKITM